MQPGSSPSADFALAKQEEPAVMRSGALTITVTAMGVFGTPVKAATHQEPFTPSGRSSLQWHCCLRGFLLRPNKSCKLAPTQPGPFADHGFHNSDAATEDATRTAMLGAGHYRFVYRAALAENAGQAYAVLSQTPLLCRVGGFDRPSLRKSYTYYSAPASGWTRVETVSTTPGVEMLRFSKAQGTTTIWINLS
jgi:hypothetical protein